VSPLLLRRLTDEQLGGRLAHGEAAAFDELYRRYAHRLAAYGSHLLGDGAAGDDVSQAAMLKAYAALRDGRVPSHVKPWLYRIAHNAAIDLVKRRRETPSERLPERADAREGDGGALLAAVATLPERQQQVYVLRELHGLRIDETAAELGLTVAQVEQALFAARNRLAEHLVFGERLNCVTVQRLAAGPLDLDERRALKSHLRSCPGCRSALGVRGRALGSLPVAPLEWLRGLAGGLLGLGAPAAAKVGVMVAGASLAAGVPIAVERTNSRPHHPAPLVFAPVRAVVHAKARVVLPVVQAPVARTVVQAAAPVAEVVHHHPRSREAEPERHGGDGHRPQAAAVPTTTESHGGGPGPSRVDTTPETTPAVTTTETVILSDDDHGGGNGGGPGPSGNGSDGGGGGGGGSSDGRGEGSNGGGGGEPNGDG
jgi:RNA polymerase sigma factor (sigma-70 family)